MRIKRQISFEMVALIQICQSDRLTRNALPHQSIGIVTSACHANPMQVYEHKEEPAANCDRWKKT